MNAIYVDGELQRFCQQCGRFHELSKFDGDKRSIHLKEAKISCWILETAAKDCRSTTAVEGSRSENLEAAMDRGTTILMILLLERQQKAVEVKESSR